MREPLVGIDLGTTNCAVAWSEGRGAIRTFDIPQLVAPGEVAARPTLPSFLYFTDPAQRSRGAVRLPWNPEPDIVAGIYAREEGALAPARLVSSAKSWLSNPRVDRTAAVLPWGVADGGKVSPVAASASLLTHLREAWNSVHAADSDDLRLERQHIVLTVPASFDEEARELTVQAARDAGLTAVTLLEEPLAALYAWIAAHRRALAKTFGGGALILVCDVGGGTTDFSLIRAHAGGDDGELGFERIAIGEHLLLGGDNLDLALAVLVEQKIADAARLSLTQRQTLRRKCSAAKEQLLSADAPAGVPITILGAGRGVVGAGVTTELGREEVVDTLARGFLPLTAASDVPARDRRVGLRELGLPFETEPAITRHLAAFLTRAGEGRGLARPDAILFNGGFFTAPLARERVLDALAGWFGTRPAVLDNSRPDAAVAIGAAFYGRLRRDPDAARRLIIRAGSARSYYVGVGAADPHDEAAGGAAICVMPRATDEGTAIELEREFVVMTNQPAAFTLYSSTSRSDPAGTLVTAGDIEDMLRHEPLVTAFRYGKRSRSVPLNVRLRVVFTETGTLELWCQSMATGHRWRLAFNLRGAEADPFADESTGEANESTGILIGEDAIARAATLIRGTFGQPSSGAAAGALTGELEAALGHGKHDWPLAAIRQLADVLLETAGGRTQSAAHEVRWLNLTGFCIRPGIGSAADAFRISELRKIYVGGLVHPREIQNQVEWLVLWQRVAAGFRSGQQRELAQRVAGALGLGQRKPPRVNAQIERESWRLLASLERLDAGERARLGDILTERIRREPRNASWLWSIGRFGARNPLYGPLNTVVAPAVAGQWLERLLAQKDVTGERAAAIGEIGARTGDPARDLPAPVIDDAIARLTAAGHDTDLLRHVVPAQRRDTGRVFGESLPEGLRLRGEE